jgi:hypothetical protein
MRDIDDFLTLVLPFAGAAPEPLVVRAIRDAAMLFCERTRTWQGEDTIATTGEEAEPISVPADAVLFEISSCAMDGKPLDPVTLKWLASERPDWRTREMNGERARWYVAPQRGTIQAVPRVAGTLLVEYVCKPSATALTLPDFLLDEYGPTIADGAAGMLLIMPNTTFGNPQLGAALYAKFVAKLDTLSNAGSRGQQGGRTRTRGRYL